LFTFSVAQKFDFEFCFGLDRSSSECKTANHTASNEVTVQISTIPAVSADSHETVAAPNGAAASPVLTEFFMFILCMCKFLI
jgi:hypothetical protein